MPVRVVVSYKDVTRLPGAPRHLGSPGVPGKGDTGAGHTAGTEHVSSAVQAYIVVAEHDQELLGILIDDISEVVRVTEDMVVPPPGGTGVVQRVIWRDCGMALVLDVDTLVEGHEMQAVAVS